MLSYDGLQSEDEYPRMTRASVKKQPDTACAFLASTVVASKPLRVSRRPVIIDQPSAARRVFGSAVARPSFVHMYRQSRAMLVKKAPLPRRKPVMRAASRALRTLRASSAVNPKHLCESWPWTSTLRLQEVSICPSGPGLKLRIQQGFFAEQAPAQP